MSSHAPSTTSATGLNEPSNPQEQITFRFCRECSNMLYPKEDRMTNKLMYACRTCQFSEEAQSSCVFRNNMYNTVGETAGVTQDVGSDPTVGEFYPDEIYSELYCTFCGRDLDGSCDEEDEEDEEMEVEVEGEGDEKEGEVKVGWIHLGEMSRMEGEEAEELDEEPESLHYERSQR
ncbi:hypothetical protein OEA41_008202 [Lepraria neglecta]|uniref:DNA-directed RNA polymerase II subunit RPB9-like zinc ribbon domain-containing protein n=1 Tax=Lepraria neglecta TaxID=209136 RepID=A0AAE0DNN1_9LECA|nr:hypothetical protein OEA41_008202 [Lepraria neglecta]